MSGAETPGGLAHTGRRPESREGAKAGRKAGSMLLLCTLCILYRVPLGDVASPPAPLSFQKTLLASQLDLRVTAPVARSCFVTTL